MAQEVAGDVVDSCGAVLAVAEVAVAEVVGNEAVLIAYCLPCMRDMVLAGLNLVDSAVEALYALNVVAAAAAAALTEAPVYLERLPVHSIHSFHDHDRWLRGFVLVEAAEILTWAERGMPLFEHCRTPLYPNSDREKSAPDLIFLDVRRARYTKYRDKLLRIAWKRPV
jgi:hypothetical protein